jgi:hypothetical protein
MGRLFSRITTLPNARCVHVRQLGAADEFETFVGFSFGGLGLLVRERLCQHFGTKFVRDLVEQILDQRGPGSDVSDVMFGRSGLHFASLRHKLA